jgi:hypothetical protein
MPAAPPLPSDAGGRCALQRNSRRSACIDVRGCRRGLRTRRAWLVAPRSFRETLKELCRRSPSDVMSRNLTSAVNDGSTHVALGFLMGFVSLDFGLTTVSSCFLIWLDMVRDQPCRPIDDYAS